MMIYLINGSLEWEKKIKGTSDITKTFYLVKNEKIKFRKKLGLKKNLCNIQNFDLIVEKLLFYCENIELGQQPDYNYMKSEIISYMTRHRKDIDWVMSWSRRTQSWKEDFLEHEALFEKFLNHKSKKIGKEFCS